MSLVSTEYNPGIRALAQSKQIPLIDYEAEILARRPTDWNGTLMGQDNVHPTATQGGYTSRADPYDPGGDATTHTTGEAADNSGYLLRTWLSIQKLKEVKSYIVDGVEPDPIADGDLAPLGDPDGIINTGDIVIALRIALGEITPGTMELAHGDMNADGVIDLSDVIVITNIVLNQ
jgi:hypothetical protein